MFVPLNCDQCGKRRAPGSFRLCPQCLADRDAVRAKQDAAEYPSMMEDVAILRRPPTTLPAGTPVMVFDARMVAKLDERLKAVEGELANLRERAEPVPPAITVEHVLTQLYERFDVSLAHLQCEIEDYLRKGRDWMRTFNEDRCLIRIVFRPSGDHQLYANGCPLL